MWIFHNEYTYFAGENPIFLSVTDKITLFARILEGMKAPKQMNNNQKIIPDLLDAPGPN